MNAERQRNLANDLFVLNIRLKMLADTIELGVDSDFFLEKTLDDLEFTSRTLTPILGVFKTNAQFVERDELCYAFYETEQRFFGLVTSLENGRGCFSASRFPDLASRLEPLRAASLERQAEVDTLLALAEKNSGDQRIVSSAELTELLAGF